MLSTFIWKSKVLKNHGKTRLIFAFYFYTQGDINQRRNWKARGKIISFVWSADSLNSLTAWASTQPQKSDLKQLCLRHSIFHLWGFPAKNVVGVVQGWQISLLLLLLLFLFLFLLVKVNSVVPKRAKKTSWVDLTSKAFKQKTSLWLMLLKSW